MVTIRIRYIITTIQQTCFACLRTFGPGTSMKEERMDEDTIRFTYTCPSCARLLTEFKEIIPLNNALDYDKGCVARVLSADGVQSPEEMLDQLEHVSVVSHVIQGNLRIR